MQIALGLRDEDEATSKEDSAAAAVSSSSRSTSPLQSKSNRKSYRKTSSSAKIGGAVVVDNKVPSISTSTTISVNGSRSPQSPVPTIASVERSLLRGNSRESRTPSQLPYRLIGVKDFSDRTVHGDCSSADEALYDLLNEVRVSLLYLSGGIIPMCLFACRQFNSCSSRMGGALWSRL